MSIELRPYQVDLYDRTRALVAAGARSVLIQAPTGAGKTQIVCYMLARAITKGAKAHFWVHRRELIRQSVLALHNADVTTGIISPDFHPNPTAPVQVCSIHSLKRRHDKLPTPQLVIADEIHHAPAATWSTMLQKYQSAGAVVIGLSATPWRLTGEGLRPWFEEMVCGPSTAELIEQGWLSKYRLFTPGSLNMAGVHVTAGDYNKKELNDKLRSSSVVGDCLSHYQKYVPGKRALIFMWSVESSIEMAQRFNEAGIPAAHIDGTTDDKTRDTDVRAFGTGDIKVLTQVDICTEGFDLPGIDSVFLLRPTKSLTLYLQAIGRALRPSPGKDCAWIFDHAQNAKRHGLPDDPREWTLDGDENRKRRKRDEDDSPLRICPQCSETYGSYVRQCRCGYLFIVQAREVDVQDGDLKEVDADMIRTQRAWEQSKADDLEKLIRLGQSRNYKFPERWARFVLQARQEKETKKQLARHAIVRAIPDTDASDDRWLF